EILRDDDVRGLLRPEAGDLDVALLEDDLALLVADDGRAHFPVHSVEGIDARQREVAREVDAGGRRGLLHAPALRFAFRSLADAGPGVSRAALSARCLRGLTSGGSFACRASFHAFLRSRDSVLTRVTAGVTPSRDVTLPAVCLWW